MKFLAFGASCAFAILFMFLSGCSKTTLPSTPGGSGPVGEVNDSAGFYVHVLPPSNITYSIHASTDTTSETECKADDTTKQILCIAETQELDLYEKGITFQINVPSNMCSWLREAPYHYYDYEPGTGHSRVRVDTNAAGQITIECPAGTTFTAEKINGVVTGSGFAFCDIDADGEWDMATEESNRTRCIYDYARQKGPNCCSGSYTMITRVYDPATAGYQTTSVPNLEWGGVKSSCLTGPAMKTQPKNDNGYPVDFIYPVDGVGINKTYVVDAPETQKMANIYAANYFTGGTAPSPTRQPYYRWQCLDSAMELKYEILVLVREWNTISDFQVRTSTNFANSDRIGHETTVPFTGYARNDAWDWLDFLGNGTAYDPNDEEAGGTSAGATTPYDYLFPFIYPHPSKHNY